MESEDKLERVLSGLAKLRAKLSDDSEALQTIDEIESLLRDKEGLAFEALRRVSRGKTVDDLVKIISSMESDADVRRFIAAAHSVPGRYAPLLFWLWVVAAGVFFIMGIYFFFPPYVLFTEMHGNITLIQRTLETVYAKPEILRAADFLFKLLGLFMLVMALASMYQAHLILERLRGVRP